MSVCVCVCVCVCLCVCVCGLRGLLYYLWLMCIFVGSLILSSAMYLHLFMRYCAIEIIIIIIILGVLPVHATKDPVLCSVFDATTFLSVCRVL